MEKSAFGDGEWIASTLGHFVSLLIDGGDTAVMYQYITSMEPDKEGRYPETLAVVLLPDGHVKRAIAACQDDNKKIHKTLIAMLKNGVIK